MFPVNIFRTVMNFTGDHFYPLAEFLKYYSEIVIYRLFWQSGFLYCAEAGVSEKGFDFPGANIFKTHESGIFPLLCKTMYTKRKQIF